MAISSFRRAIEEISSPSSSYIEEGRKPKAPERTGFATGVPIGGSTEWNTGDASTSGSLDRATFMLQMQQAYLTCTWASAAIDTVARTATAGGIEVVPLSGVYSNLERVEATPEVKKVQELLRYVNPRDDIRQLMRGVITDMQIYGDAFTEVVWVAGEPVALYPLDPTTITILADEHGMVKGYFQKTATMRTAYFKPHEVIHCKFDTPGDTLYGVSPTQKVILPITTWLFAASVLREVFKKGDPLRAHVDWPIALPESEMRRLQQQYQIRNLGAKNIGNLFETKGGAIVKELGVNQIANWLATLQERRDEILSGYGVPPSKVGVIEAGNIGGGTGTSQEKMFRVNTIGPIQEIVLEKFAFSLLVQAFKVHDWTLKFGVVDWRDDETIEQIRDQRIRNGTWALNRARADIGEPPVPGGDEPVLVDRQNMVLWKHLEALSAANLAAAQMAADPLNDSTGGGVNAVKGPTTNPGKPSAPGQTTKPKPVKVAGQTATAQGAPKPPAGSENLNDEGIFEDDDI